MKIKPSQEEQMNVPIPNTDKQNGTKYAY